MRIGVLARRAGIKASRLRFYELHGLLPPPARLASGYRDYDERALTVVVFITRARALGFSLAEISAHLASPQDAGRKARLLDLVERKIGEVDARLAALGRLRDVLADLTIELQGLVGPRTSKPD